MDLPRDKYLVPKDPQRYSSVSKFKYDQILGKYNDRVIMDFIDKIIYED